MKSGKTTLATQEEAMLKQLNELKSILSNTEAKIRHKNERVNELQKEVKERDNVLKSAKRDKMSYEENMKKLRNRITELTQEKEALGFDSSEYEKQLKEEKIYQAKISEMHQTKNAIFAKYAFLDFKYSDPEPSFDRKKVFGRVARLFTFQDDSITIALEVIAGGKLFNVVVDSEKTSEALLSKRCTQFHTIFIPNNKIKYRTVSEQV